jgi:hypothetical protein
LQIQTNPFSANVGQGQSANSVAQIKARALREVTGPVDYLDGCNDQATILCLDEFHPLPGTPPEVDPHGEYVVSVLRAAGLEDSQIQKIHQHSASEARNALFEPGPETPQERLRAFIELHALEDLESTRHAIRQATTRPGNQIKTITNSLGSTPVRLANGIFANSVTIEDGVPTAITEVGEFVFEALAIPAELSEKNVRELRSRLLTDTVDVVEQSPSFRLSRGRFQRELEALQQKGISYFLSAGNDQKRVDELRQQGYSVSPLAAYISKSVPSAELVAALDTRETADLSDDVIADFSSDHPLVSYAAKGVGVLVQGRTGPKVLKGSSLSAPWVAAKRELHRQEHPNLRASELEVSFRQTSPRMLDRGIAIID